MSPQPAATSKPEGPGKLITFYSYKGGTGRTMALANVACLLEQRHAGGRGVLVIDWDLEAPGLHRYFRGRFQRQFGTKPDAEAQLDEAAGLIDLFLEIQGEVRARGEEGALESCARDILAKVDPKRFILATDLPGLFLLKAGRFDAQYSKRVAEFRWDDLYESSPHLFRVFAEWLGQQYQYVLIDSRTGLTDTSGICTTLLPEKLVVVFTPNRQSLTGGTEQLRGALQYRQQSEDLRPLIAFPLASRIESTEPQLRNDWRLGNKAKGITGYQRQLEALFEELYGLTRCSLTRYFDDIQLPHVPQYAYGEQLPVLEELGRDRFSLTRSYEILTELLSSDRTPWDEQQLHSGQREEVITRAEGALARTPGNELEQVKKLLTRLVRVAGPDERAADSRLYVSEKALTPDQRRLAGRLIEAGVVAKRDGEIELAHDALVTEWKRLQVWLDEDREFLVWRQHELGPRLRAWERSDRAHSELLHDSGLEEALGWLKKRSTELTVREKELVLRSQASQFQKRMSATAFLVVSVSALIAGLLYKHTQISGLQTALERAPNCTKAHEVALKVEELSGVEGFWPRTAWVSFDWLPRAEESWKLSSLEYAARLCAENKGADPQGTEEQKATAQRSASRTAALLYRRAVERLEASAAPDSELAVKLLESVLRSRQVEGKQEPELDGERLDLARRLVGLLEQRTSVARREAIRHWHKLADTYDAAQRKDQAQDCYKLAYQLAQDSFGDTGREATDVKLAWADFLSRTGQVESAFPLYEQLMARSDPTASPLPLAKKLHSLALAEQKAGHPELADRMLHASLRGLGSSTEERAFQQVLLSDLLALRFAAYAREGKEAVSLQLMSHLENQSTKSSDTKAALFEDYASLLEKQRLVQSAETAKMKARKLRLSSTEALSQGNK